MYVVIKICLICVLCITQQLSAMHNDPLRNFKRQELNRALFDYDIAGLAKLLKEYPDLANFRDTLNYTPLHRLAGKLLCLSCLQKDNSTLPPEQANAIQQAQELVQDMIKLLVHQGANINATMDNPIKGLKELFNETPLTIACRRSCWRTIQTLLACGADVNKYTAKGESTLELVLQNEHMASACKERAVIGILVAT